MDSLNVRICSLRPCGSRFVDDGVLPRVSPVSLHCGFRADAGAALAAMVASLIALPAHAGSVNLVTNGSFESLTDAWARTGDLDDPAGRDGGTVRHRTAAATARGRHQGLIAPAGPAWLITCRGSA